MRVLTLNTWQERGPWRDRWEVIFRGLHELQPDIICFQEVFNADWAQSLPHRTGLSYAASTAGDGGLVILSRWPMVMTVKQKLPTQSLTEGYDRFLLYAEVDTGRMRLGIVNTHLSWKPEEGKVREGQTGDLIAFLHGRGMPGEHMLMGDLNAVPESPEICRLAGEGELLDSYGFMHRGEAGMTWDNQNPYAAMARELDKAPDLPDRRLDYLFIPAKSGLKAALAAVTVVYQEPDHNGVRASDHYGLCADFDFG